MRAILLIGLFASSLMAVQVPFLDMNNEKFEMAKKKCTDMLFRAIGEVSPDIEKYGTAEQKINALYASAEIKTLCILTHGGYGTKFLPMNYETFKVLLKAGAEQ